METKDDNKYNFNEANGLIFVLTASAAFGLIQRYLKICGCVLTFMHDF